MERIFHNLSMRVEKNLTPKLVLMKMLLLQPHRLQNMPGKYAVKYDLYSILLPWRNVTRYIKYFSKNRYHFITILPRIKICQMMFWLDDNNCEFFFPHFGVSSLNFYEVIKTEIIQISRNYFWPVIFLVTWMLSDERNCI